MTIFKKTVTYLAALLAAVVIIPSCEKEEDHDYREAIVRRGVPFSLQIDDLKPVDTKSVINDPYIETKITCVTLASYSASSGQLISTEYFVAGEDLVLDTGSDSEATVYAFVNMGDLTGVLPANQSMIAAVTYDIPAYTGSDDSIEERGIPMAGVLNYDTANHDETTISVRRLLAKLAVDLSLDWDATITSVQIKSMNKHLTPFGESWARFASDTFSEEIESGNGLSSGTFVFYIPENEQGTVPSIVSSVDKSGDNSALSAMKDCLTYMEVTTEGAGLYSGTMVYRSYLGKNATSDFSITRNCRYTWAVTYKKDGTSEDDWKHENNLSWSAWRYTLTVNDEAFLKSYRGYVGDWAVCSLRKQVDRYEKGLKQTSSFEPFDPDIVTWTTENWSPGNFMSYISTQSYTRGVRRVYSMIAEGSGYVRATIEDEMGTYTSSVWFSCLGVTPTLVLSVTPASVPLGGTFQFSLDMHQESDSWSCLDGATFRLRDGYFGLDTYGKQVFYDYSNEYIGTDGRWTPTVIGTYRMDALSDRYSAYRLESNVITFTVTEPDVESYALRIDPTSPSPRMVGQTISLNAYLDKYVNGTRTDITDVTDSAVWSCDNAAVSVSGGSVTSLLPGTFTINVRCDSPDGVQNASVNVTFTADTNYISLSVNPTSVYVGGESTAMVRWNGSSDVTSGSTITAYTSEDGSAGSSIVTISGGTITGTSVGTCYLEASYTAGSKTYHSARVRLDVVSDVYTITLSPKPANVQMGKTLQFNYSMTKNGAPFTPSAGDISWSVISGTDKASITTGGLASGLATGTATVKVAYKSDVATDTASLEVTAPDETYRLVSLTVTPNPLTVGGANGSSVVKYQKYVNGVKSGEETVLWNNNFTWTSSNEGIATVGTAGLVTPVAAGTATITATYNGSSLNFETGYTSVSAEVTVLGPLTLSWASSYTDPKYVAQLARLNVSGQASSGITVTYTVKSGAGGLQFNSPSPTGTFVGFLAAGDYTIVATASNGQRGEISFTVNNPVAVQNWTSQALWVDGTPSDKMLHYETLEGVTMTIGQVDYQGYGTKFAPSLYESLLKPSIVRISPAVHGHFTNFLEMDSNEAVYVKTLKYSTSDSRGDIRNWLGTEFNVIIQAGVEQLTYSTSFKDPFADVDITNNEETFHDFTTIYSHMTSSQIATYNASKTYSFASGSNKRLYAQPANVLTQTSSEIQTTRDALVGTYSGGNSVSIGLTAGTEGGPSFYHPSGKKPIYIHVQNRYDIAAGGERARYSLSKQIGKAKIYMHAVFATVVKPQSNSSQYVVDILNSPRNYKKQTVSDVWDIRYLYGGFLNNQDATSNGEVKRLFINVASGNPAFVRLALTDEQGFEYRSGDRVLTAPYGFVQRRNLNIVNADCCLGIGYAILKTTDGSGNGITWNWSTWKNSSITSPFCTFDPSYDYTQVSWSENGLTGRYFTDNYSEKDNNRNGYLIIHLLQDMPVNPNNGYIE